MSEVQLPREVVDEARAAGGGWYYEIIGSHEGPVPQEAVRGAWRIDAEGCLTGEYVENPRYRPRGQQSRGCPFHRPVGPPS